MYTTFPTPELGPNKDETGGDQDLVKGSNSLGGACVVYTGPPWQRNPERSTASWLLSSCNPLHFTDLLSQLHLRQGLQNRREAGMLNCQDRGPRPATIEQRERGNYTNCTFGCARLHRLIWCLQGLRRWRACVDPTFAFRTNCKYVHLGFCYM